MSLYKLQKCAKGYSVVCGWDRPLQTFFVKIRKSHQLIIWKGTNYREMPNLSDLHGLLVGIAQIPPDIASALESERNGAGAWTAKVFDRREVEDVLLNALKAKNTEHQAVLALYEQLKNNQSKRRISTAEGIILELLELCHADKREGCERDPFGGDNRELTRWLGAQANQLGGMEMMQSICYCVYPEDRRDLDHAWHGIGDWLS